MKRFLLYFGAIVLIFGLAGFFLFVGALGKSELSYPSTFIGPNSIGMLSENAVKDKLEMIFARYEKKPMLFAFEGEAAKVTPEELGISFDREEAFRRVPFVESKNPFGHLLNVLKIHDVLPVFSFEKGKLLKTLEEKFSTVTFMHNARFKYDKNLKQAVVESEEIGIRVDESALASDLRRKLKTLGREPVFLQVKQSYPDVHKEDLEADKDKLLALLPKKIVLKFKKEKWEMNFPRDIEIIEFQKNADFFEPVVSEKDIEIFVEQHEIAKAIEYPADGLKAYIGSDGKVKFEGHGTLGRRINRLALASAIKQAIDSKLDSIEISVSEVEPLFNISEDLQKLGIKEVLGVGYSTYYGSPKNRIHNIGVGTEHFNGTIIKPGEVYSLVANLGPVDVSTGYKEELVIKHDGTKPEFGGGLCQVSTTFYRGALNSGLPIIERSPHTYAVTYYSQAGGHGLDATIYPGSHDLKFLNDTPGHILVHSYVNGLEAYFKFYGTLDGRSVRFEGPFVSKKTPSPPDEFVYTKDKPEGSKELKEKPHPGFDAVWYRYVTRDGEEKKETIFSHYKAMPAKYLVGGEGPAKIDVEAEKAKQYE